MKDGSCRVFTGGLGGGKTLAAVERIMDHLVDGGTVVTNIPLHVDKIARWLARAYAYEFDPDRLKLLHQGSMRNFHDLAVRGNDEQTVLFVVDEAAMDLNARDWKQAAHERFEFVVLCRKLGVDLILIAQDANDIDKQLREKFQFELHCRSLKQFPIMGYEIGLPLFVRVEYMLQLGAKPHRTRATWHWKSPAWGYYDSFALHGERAQLFGALEQAKSGKLRNVKTDLKPYFIGILVATLTSLAICLSQSI